MRRRPCPCEEKPPAPDPLEEKPLESASRPAKSLRGGSLEEKPRRAPQGPVPAELSERTPCEEKAVEQLPLWKRRLAWPGHPGGRAQGERLAVPVLVGKPDPVSVVLHAVGARGPLSQTPRCQTNAHVICEGTTWNHHVTYAAARYCCQLAMS